MFIERRMRTAKDEIWERVAACATDGFFVTVTFDRMGKETPEDVETFVEEKCRRIREGVSGRKYIYNKVGWRMVFTFFPTDRVVDERYALKNKVLFRKPE